IEDLDVEADAFLGGKGVHVAADRVDLASDGFGGTCLSPLEYHVLNEVGNPIPFGVFIPRAGLEPDADADRAKVGHLFGNNGQAVRQYAPMNVASFFNHCLIYFPTLNGSALVTAVAALVCYSYGVLMDASSERLRPYPNV